MLRVANFISTVAAFAGILAALGTSLVLLWSSLGKSSDLPWRILGSGLVVAAAALAVLFTLKFFYSNRGAS